MPPETSISAEVTSSYTDEYVDAPVDDNSFSETNGYEDVENLATDVLDSTISIISGTNEYQISCVFRVISCGVA